MHCQNSHALTLCSRKYNCQLYKQYHADSHERLIREIHKFLHSRPQRRIAAAGPRFQLRFAVVQRKFVTNVLGVGQTAILSEC